MRHSWIAAVVFAAALFSPSAPLSSEPVITLEQSLAGTPPYRRLFLDGMVVEESAGLDRIFPAATKYEGNPIITKDKPWEGWGPYLYGTVMWDDGKLKMWYGLLGDKCADVAYAESTDGLKWTKPNLGIMDYEGSKNNNIMAAHNTAHLASVIRNPKPASPTKRWSMFCYGYDKGARVVYSGDGLRWNWVDDPATERIVNTSDVTNYFWDPYRNRYVLTFKTTNRRHRAAGVAYSQDGLKWTKPFDGAVFGADELDPDSTQVYGMPVFPYQGLYIGLPWMYHARWIKYGRYSNSNVMFEAQEGSPRTVDVQLAWSWDLTHWTRTAKREPFIANGPDKSWDDGMIYTARAPVIVGDKLYFYYGGFDQIHEDYKGITGAVGLATLRLDGFCAMKAGDSEGWLISRREMFKTPQVTINAATHGGGYITAELVDRNNNVIKGFSKQDCIPFKGDSVRATLRWNTSQFPEKMLKADKKIKFYLKNAEIYSYLPADIDVTVDDSNPDH